MLLLVIALGAVFLFGGDRGHFYRPGHHDWVTSEHMALAANLSPEHSFLMFFYRYPAGEDGSSYVAYNRWPIGSYPLIKLATLPLGENLSAWIWVGRTLMLLLFAGAAVMAYLALCRLFSNRWVALGAALLAFSSYYALYFNDMVASDAAPSIFGMMLTFHGMVVFVQEGRLRQLLVKACAALLLGWYVYALIAPFVLFGLVSEAVRARSSVGGKTGSALAASAARSPYLTLGVAALLFGFLVLGFNLTNEYFALQGQYRLTELPTFDSLQRRIGVSAEFNAQYSEFVDWGRFLKEHFYRLGGLILPHWVSSNFGALENPARPIGLRGDLVVAAGAAVSVVCLAWALLSRYRVLLAALAVSGFVWALTFRYAVTFHEFMILSSIGVPLLSYAIAMSLIHRLSGGRLTAALASAAALMFAVSAFQIGRIGHDAESARFHETVIADFERIRHVTRPGDRIFVPVPDANAALVPFAGARSAVNFYLSGRVLGYRAGDISAYDFVLARLPLDPGPSLTPENRLIFLYRPGGYAASLRDAAARIRETAPVVRSGYDVYLQDGSLTLLKEECSSDDVRPRFLLHLTPANADDLPSHRRRYGFDNLDFDFYAHGVRFEGNCLVQVPLPDYDITEIRVGQFVYEPGVFRYPWREEFRPPA